MRWILGIGMMVLFSTVVTSLRARETPQVKGATYSVVQHGGAEIDVIVLDLDEVSLRMLWRDGGAPYKSLRAASGKVHPLVVMNGGIYGKDLAPLGLHVENGIVETPLNLGHGGGNFFLKPNGVFFIRDGKAGLLESREFNRAVGPEHVEQATQSGPMLVRRGALNAAFKRGSDKRAIRNGIGVRSPTEVVLAVSHGPINMHDFAALFRDVLGCQDALYLDGTISALHAPELGPTVGMMQDGRFVGMIAAVPRVLSTEP